MPIPQAELEKRHQDKIVPITDQTSRFSFKYECSCGIQGHFYTQEQADKYRAHHLERQGLTCAKSGT